MRKINISFLFFIIVGVGSLAANGQADVGIKANFAGGEVTSVSETSITIKTKDGDIAAKLSSATVYKRVPPENPTLKAASESSFSEIGAGDNILVTGAVTPDQKTIVAKTVYLMTKSDIENRLAKERDEWRKRGIAGKVISVDPVSKEITMSTRSMLGETKTVITPNERVEYHRYAQDSVQFSEAERSTLDEISAGDMIRALGDKGENNTFKAEFIITGAFQTTAGTVTAVDVEKNEITLNDIQSKKPVTIVIGKSSTLKEFPAELAQRLAMMQMMQAGGARPQQGGQGASQPAPPATDGQPGGNRPGTGQGGGRGVGGSIDDMLERFPAITVADIKVGDSVAVSSSRSSASSVSGRITAIKLLSGIEPFLKVPQMGGGRGGRGGQQGGGQDSGFNIPGLDDGFGIP